MVKKRDIRIPFTTYFEPEEFPDLETAKKKAKRDGSSLIRWLVSEYAAGRLVEWHVAQTEQLVSLTRRLMHEVESMRAAHTELPPVPPAPTENPAGGRGVVRAKISEIGGSSKDSGKPSSSHQHPK